MLKPSENIITVPHKSTYSLVIAVAKRARQIAQKAEDEGTILVDKPVDMAVQDFVQGKYIIIEPDTEPVPAENE
ncbi:rNA polymerase Rpb6 [Clostridium sp. CAG:1013]|jgi:DNA-directed RNA polymerase subunit omega|nr:rNA polymerase Rpb6 [Clostridium sp. CAG:1013]